MNTGDHQVEVDVNLDEMVELISEVLELPNIEEKVKALSKVKKLDGRIFVKSVRGDPRYS